jgi:two-component system, NtrC family, nitrogen regulation sensor histidine kinase NtrY
MLSIRNLLLFISALCILGAGIWHHHNHKRRLTEQGVANQVVVNLTKLLAIVDDEAKRLGESPATEKIWTSTSHAFYLADSTGILAWTRNSFVPDKSLLQESFNHKIVQNPYGDFLICKWPLSAIHFLICVIPLAERYKVSNQYLSPTWNKEIFPIDGVKIHAITDGEGAIICSSSTSCYFKISLSATADNFSADVISLFLLSIGILLILLLLYRIVWRLHRSGKYELAFFILFLALYAIRLIMINTGFPTRFSQLDIFDPHFFAASSLNVSLGDFVLNASVVFICCVYVFLYYKKPKWFIGLPSISIVYQSLVGILSFF